MQADLVALQPLLHEVLLVGAKIGIEAFNRASFDQLKPDLLLCVQNSDSTLGKDMHIFVLLNHTVHVISANNATMEDLGCCLGWQDAVCWCWVTLGS
jgi:hypothetical protein